MRSLQTKLAHDRINAVTTNPTVPLPIPGARAAAVEIQPFLASRLLRSGLEYYPHAGNYEEADGLERPPVVGNVAS